MVRINSVMLPVFCEECNQALFAFELSHDTVLPPGDMEVIFGDMREGSVYGLGAADCKVELRRRFMPG